MRINTIRLRKWAGFLGMALPWIVALLIGYIPDSISATYYTNASTAFVIVLGAASMILISYKGYSKTDDTLLTCSGIAGFGVCLFPCSVTEEHVLVGTFVIDNYVSNALHYVFAIVFFLLLAYNSLFLFTKHSGEMTKRKKARNVIFRVCGVGMVASFAILLLPYFYAQTWITEMIALTFFGISFLTKANIYPWLFCEPKTKNKEETNGN